MNVPVKSVLFVCNMNSVRSPMAAFLAMQYFKDHAEVSTMPSLVDSAGVYSGWLDPFTEEVLGEVGIKVEEYASKSVRDIEPDQFDLVVVMTPEAAGELRRIVPDERMEFWPINNPSTETGGRETVMTAYRAVRDEILEKIRHRFPDTAQNT